MCQHRHDGVPEGLISLSESLVYQNSEQLEFKTNHTFDLARPFRFRQSHIAWIGFGNHSNNNTTHQIYFNSFDLTGTPNVSNGTVSVANLSTNIS